MPASRYMLAAAGGATFDLVNDFVERLLAKFRSGEGLLSGNINEIVTAGIYYYAAKKGMIPEEVALGAIGAAAARIITLAPPAAGGGGSSTAALYAGGGAKGWGRIPIVMR